ncbi:hypothetical protein EIP91_004354 [Steccherinum ochraceum]|uniref:BTB domain-containing protein n=1 Tax=Steccherinum ochraceum TaxID=92696 RepID=A0A4R0RHE0_9APHY|nr:hypothetical protein EIP91_004354 [Steccherinum ochraceum]
MNRSHLRRRAAPTPAPSINKPSKTKPAKKAQTRKRLVVSSVEAHAPFNVALRSCIILQSSDNGFFYVSAHILMVAAPVLASQLSGERIAALPVSQDDIPILAVPELNSAQLLIFLQFLYPIANPTLLDVLDLAEVSKFSSTYEIEFVTQVLDQELKRCVVLQPLFVWVSACLTKSEAWAYTAALGILNSPENEDLALSFYYTSDLNHTGVTAGMYYRLLQFLEKGGRVDASYQLLQPPNHVDDESMDLEMTCLDAAILERAPADVVVASKDVPSALYPAHKAVLQIASSVWAQDLCRLRARSSSQLPTLHLEDAPVVIRTLIRWVYGDCMEEDTVDLETCILVLEAADRYEMSKVKSKAKAELRKIVQLKPLQGYFAAVAHGWDDMATFSAKLTASIDDIYPYALEMENAPPRSYYNLLRYRATARDVMMQVVNGYLATGRTPSLDRSGASSLSSFLPASPAPLSKENASRLPGFSDSNIHLLRPRFGMTFTQEFSLAVAVQLENAIEAALDQLRLDVD